jgi:hypothetical protein
MNDHPIKGIPAHLVEEMRRLGIRPGDEFFLLIRLMAESGTSLEDVLRDVSSDIDGLRQHHRETTNLIVGQMSAVAANSLAESRRLYYGDGVNAGIMEMADKAATSASVAASTIQFSANQIGSAADSINAMIGKVQTKNRRNYLFSFLLTNLFFALGLVLYVYCNMDQFVRVLATRNAPQIAEAFATKFAGQPLPDYDSLAGSDSPIPIKSYLHGIGQMPPQLALVIYSSIAKKAQLDMNEIHALRGQIAELKKELERNRRVPILNIKDGSWVIRVDDQRPEIIRLKNYDGFFVRVHPDFSETLSSKDN